MNNYQLLINKLDEFIRKYYKNQVLRGIIYTLSFFLVSFLVISLLENFGHFNTVIRTILFYAFVAGNLFILVYWVGLPLLHWFRLGKVISHDQAADIIGKHFPNVSDKLLNTLQLKKMAEQKVSESQRQIIQASINQRIDDLKPVPFTQAVNLGENKKYLKYAIAPLLILLIISFIRPTVVFDSTERLIKHRTYYEEKAPFSFKLANDTLRAVRQENYTVRLNIDGNELPKEVYVYVDDKRFRMNKKGPDKHKYTLRNLQDNFRFQFEANGFYSNSYEVKVLPQPVLQQYTLKLDYPDYTGKKDKAMENVGDLNIPAGTRVKWQFKTQNTDQIKMVFNDTTIHPSQSGENTFDVKKAFYQNQQYYVKPSNEYMTGRDSSIHYVSVVPDAYPNIKVQKESDSLSTNKRQFFTGEISDDYGLTRLAFHYEYTESKDTAKLNKGTQTEYLDVQNGETIQNFYHSWDLNKLDIEAGDRIAYYFEVWDNDGVNGRKSARSRKFEFKAPTRDELEEKMEKTQESIKSKLKATSKKARELREKLDKARQKMLNKKNLSWEDKQFIQETIQKHKQLQKEIKNLQQQYKQNLRQQNEYKQLDQSMKEKYERMNEIMEKTVSEEMKKQLKELEKMLDKEDKKAIEKEMEKLDRNNESTRKQLERSLELYKQLALEQKIRSTSKELDQLAEKQEKLSKETEKKKDGKQDKDGKQSGEQKHKDKAEDSKKGDGKDKSGDKQNQEGQKEGSKSQKGKKGASPEKKQEKLNKNFEDVQKDLENIDKLNQELGNQKEMKEPKEHSKEIQKLMKQSLQKLRQQQNQGASQKQKKASDKMKEMSEKMQQMLSQMNQKSLMLNYQKVRQILENLIQLSNEQEDLMKQFENIHGYNPQFVKYAREQSKLKEDAAMIEDSLQALSKKVMQIRTTVNREIEDINYHMGKVRDYISTRRIGKIRSSQQYIMTATNNLAVMLSEVMDQMQQQMASSMSGSQMCKQPKPMPGPGKKSKMNQLQQMQKKLGEQMKNLKKGDQASRQGATSKELARMAKLQEQIRQRLRELRKQQEEKGSGKPSDELKELEKLMKDNEKDIINNDISGETLERQQKINVKMLEAKKAQRTQGMDKQRKSQTADQLFRENPPSLEEYKKERERQIELLRTVPPTLNGYYRMKVQEYFKAIQ